MQVCADQPIAQGEVYIYSTTGLGGAAFVDAQDGGDQCRQVQFVLSHDAPALPPDCSRTSRASRAPTLADVAR